LNRVLPVGCLTLLLCACSLSPEQAIFPGSLLGSSQETAAVAGGSDAGPYAGAEGNSAHIRTGSGEFTAGLPEGAGASDRVRTNVDENGVSLNLVGASVPEVAKTILGDILKVNYTVSDKVNASITLSTANPVPRNDLLEIFESILNAENIAIEERNNVYHLLPADAAGSGGTRWASNRNRTVGDATAIIPLRYVSAVEMERILKAVAPQSSILRVDISRNLLLVSGSAAELDSINASVKTFDVDWMKGMSFALLPVESADPEVIARELEIVFAQEAGSPTEGIIRFVPNTRLKSVLMISSRPEYLQRASGWLRRIDLAGQATERRVHVYRVKNRPAAELAVLLRKVYVSQLGGRDGVSASTLPQEASAVLSDDGGADEAVVNGLPSALATAQGNIGADSPALQELVAPSPGGQDADAGGQSEANPGGISIVADEANNSLITTATLQEYKRIERILSQIDIAANQILLEATIAEVTLTDRLKFGLKWFFEKGNSSATFTTNSVGDIVSGFPGFSYFLNTPNVQVALDALNSVTTVNLVSSPSLMVLDNKKAVLQFGDEVPIATQQATSVLTPGAPIVNSISFRSTGVILGITPRIGDNGRIQLDIEQEVSDVKRTDTSNLDSPTISQRRIKTSVAVGDGESIVLAGLMRDRSEVLHDKVPLVGDIPVLGNLFKSKDDEITRTELLIAITPHIVSDPRQIRSIADEFRDRMNFTSRPQRGGPPDRRENVDRLIVR
jgi:general secretion pathway protein D